MAEFRMRQEFLRIRQTKSLHEYVQQTRYLISGIVANPVDESTKISIFMAGMKKSRARTELYRRLPGTLEEAIEIAMQEDFSHRSAQEHFVPAHMKDGDAMDLSAVAVRHGQKRYSSEKKTIICYNCGGRGHLSPVCPSKPTNGRKINEDKVPHRAGQGNDQHQ